MTSNHPLATRSPHSVGVVVRLAFVLLGLSQANAQPKKQPEQAQAKRNKASVDMRLFIAVRRQWEELALRDMISRNPQIPLPPGRKVEPITKKELAEAEQQLAKRCLTLSEKYPGTSGELGALYLAASRTGDTKHGVTARKKLVSRFATTKLEDFQKVIRYAGTSMVLTQQFIDGRRKIFESIAPELLKKVRKDPKQPAADVLLTRVCTYTTYPHREEVPQFFTTCAELIIEHHAGSAEIYNFCETLGGMNPSPTWGPKFDKHLKTILAQNKHRWVRCTASMALARMAERTGQLDDARKQYRQYIKDFDGRHKYQFQNVESQARLVATQRLNKLMKQQ